MVVRWKSFSERSLVSGGPYNKIEQLEGLLIFFLLLEIVSIVPIVTIFTIVPINTIVTIISHSKYAYLPHPLLSDFWPKGSRTWLIAHSDGMFAEGEDMH